MTLVAYERFIPPTRHGRPARVTVRPSGLISFDQVAVASFALADHSHAVLYFDRSSRRIGVTLGNDPDEPGSLPLSARGASVNLRAATFFRRIGLTLARPRRLEVTREAGADLLEIDLAPLERRRGRRRAGRPAP